MGHIALPAVTDTASVAGLRNAIFELRGADLEIDASEVQRLSGLGLQVLIAAARHWTMEDLKLSFVRPSPAFTDILRLTGADQLPELAA
jgi:chemotaxis protein CheX